MFFFSVADSLLVARLARGVKQKDAKQANREKRKNIDAPPQGSDVLLHSSEVLLTFCGLDFCNMRVRATRHRQARFTKCQTPIGQLTSDNCDLGVY